jgi:hypothetical protein
MWRRQMKSGVDSGKKRKEMEEKWRKQEERERER